MPNAPIYVLINLLFGIFATAAAGLVLYYRKNFTLHNGVAILLFAVGIYSFSNGIMTVYDSRFVCLLYLFSHATIPIFLVLFSEYILKVNYHIVIKLLILSATWFFIIGSFVQRTVESSGYVAASTIFSVLVLCVVIFSVTVSYFSSGEKLLKKYLIIFLIALLFVLSSEVSKIISDDGYHNFYSGLSAFVVTHAIILIITSGGYSRIKQKLPALLYIVGISLLLCILLRFLHSELELKHLLSLLVLSTGVLSMSYLWDEVSKGPKKIGSTLLISRLLTLPLHDKEQFLVELRKWEEICELHLVKHESIEGNLSDLSSLFVKVGRSIHKYQIATLDKALAFNPNLRSGIEVSRFYFKKFDCHSLFQISENGDFLAIKYMKGLNPALFSNEISMMTKIVFSVSGNSKTT